VSALYLVRPKADQDLDDQAYYLATQSSPDLGHRFLLAAHETFGMLATQPLIGWHSRLKHPELSSLRVFRISGFEKMLVLYLPRRMELRFYEWFTLPEIFKLYCGGKASSKHETPIDDSCAS